VNDTSYLLFIVVEYPLSLHLDIIADNFHSVSNGHYVHRRIFTEESKNLCKQSYKRSRPCTIGYVSNS